MHAGTQLVIEHDQHKSSSGKWSNAGTEPWDEALTVLQRAIRYLLQWFQVPGGSVPQNPDVNVRENAASLKAAIQNEDMYKRFMKSRISLIVLTRGRVK